MGLFSKKKKQIEVFAPVDGEIISLDLVEDEVFQERMMGDGFAVIPANGVFVAPIDGQLVTVFPTKHAYGIKNDSGIELLIHIGLDTVTLEGKGFSSKVEQGQKVKVGDELVKVNLKEVTAAVPSIKTPVVFTNTNGKTIEVVKFGKVKKGDLVAVLK
ncbi:PTS sugar transporter subunit IIA [Mesoplasma seiffertii]|uniref:PTS sugar transporter subunit IIA n=1 Tax=Mesoplasma seiffertii TaxID=28224 RepID=UPI00047E666F|nr:PTS glucose transporter subunit IIA [Mesoplasma seiffertii]